MKFSRFNFFIKKLNKVYLFNTRTGEMCKISQKLCKTINSNDNIKPEFNKTLLDLKKKKFVIDSSIDELSDLNEYFTINQNNVESASITFAPTQNCNFDCVYCYEKKEKKNISNNDLNILIDFLEKKVIKKIKYILFSWFGGEPTLCKEIMINFTNKIITLCNKYNVKYKFMIITNGYLIDKDLINFYKSINNIELCITIDGFKIEHDKRRYLKNKSGTFDQIISNLKLLLANKINVTVRINIDRKNKKDAFKLINYFKKEKIKPNKVYLGHIQNFTDSCKNEKKNCLNKKEYAQVQNKFNTFLYKKKMRLNRLSYEGPKNTFCKVSCKNSFIIDNNLNIYKCENDIGRENLKLGKILKTKIIEHKDRFINWSPFNYDKCRNCTLLPSCFGGCAFTSIQFGEPQCPAYKYNIKNDLKKMIREFEKTKF